MSLKIVLIALAYISVALTSKEIEVINRAVEDIIVNAPGWGRFRLENDGAVYLTIDNFYFGFISACRNCDGDVEVKTKVMFEISDLTGQDKYAVDLLDGFNLPVVVTPNDNTNCPIALCATDINKVCPDGHEIFNDSHNVTACTNEPDFFEKVCPDTILTPNNTDRVKVCNAAPSYTVVFGEEW